jgi:hypothetical protein
MDYFEIMKQVKETTIAFVEISEYWLRCQTALCVGAWADIFSNREEN